ncbi:MAG: hypothetical protein JRI50_10725 [Deltaproteobacteria bacterium]|nr:hypothetical protein [Deltaproteobacteria bacterium]MBW1987674.1 hypothetical protein [Deltaproteobacteria bacterium]
MAEKPVAGLAGVLKSRSCSISALLLLTGLVVCLASIWGLTETLCITKGCQVYQSYHFLGLSFYAWGAAAFGAGLVLLVCNAGYYRVFIYGCLLVEIVLLAYQVIYLPCSECLLVGLLWGSLGFLAIKERISLTLWSALFLAALVILGKEMVAPWPVYGHTDAPVKVYFSPTCPACKEEIGKLLSGGEADWNRVAFCPVAMSEEDCKRLCGMKFVLDRTLNLAQAFQACWSGNAEVRLGWEEWLKLRLGLIKNRIVLARMGADKIPLVVSGSLAAGEATGDCDLFSGEDCIGMVNLGHTGHNHLGL